MSVTAMRRSYHHGDLRQVLMKAAREHIAVEGTEKLSLRALAREAGVSPTAPYRHFPTKNCLLAAIAAEGFAELQDTMHRQVHAAGPDVLDQLSAAARAYVQYALENPVKFHLMTKNCKNTLAPRSTRLYVRSIRRGKPGSSNRRRWKRWCPTCGRACTAWPV